MTQRVVEELSEQQCLELADGETIARFVFQDSEGPAALPINFGLAGKDIIFRTESGSHFLEVLHGPVAIEMDSIDTETGMGWSILLRGQGREVPLDAVPELLKQMGDNFPHPWAEGVHNVWIAVTAEKITGRRLTQPYFAANF